MVVDFYHLLSSDISTKDMGTSIVIVQSYSIGKEDLRVVPLMKSLLAEFLGTMLLVIFGCGTAMQEAGTSGYATKV